MEICETAQKIGLLQYQLDKEIPEELEKLMIKMHNLDREGKKMLKEQDALQAALRENATEVALPAEDVAETPPAPEPETVN